MTSMNLNLTYEQAVDLLEGALVFGIDPSLEPMRKMCEELGNPQERYRCVQVAGTNGKTSTTRMIAALMRAQGLHVGLYTSPHLMKYPERIEVNGAIVSDEMFARGIEAAARAAQASEVEATEFELLTTAALWIFAQEGVEWAVLECGLGGRWDATSVVMPDVAVITGIGLDHTHILGDTLEQIAAEKAAIIKPGSVAVLADGLAAREVFEARAAEVGAQIVNVICQRALTPLANMERGATVTFPSYQQANLSTASAAVTAALGESLSRQTVDAALAQLVIPGRFEVLSEEPLVVVDAAHNPQSAEILAREIVRRFEVARVPAALRDVDRLESLKPVPALLLGVLVDKDAEGIIDALVPLFDRVVVSASSSPRAIPADDLAVLVEQASGMQPRVAQTIPEALALLSGGSFLATGSITVAGEVKAFW